MSQYTGSIEIHRALGVTVRAARLGGGLAKARLGDPGYLKWKGHRDVVSEASLQVQEAIVSTLLAEFPDSGILAEEGPEDASLAVDAAHLWIVDPICGSLNFVQGIPYFGVSIALRSEGNIRVGVVYDPCRDELFEATTEAPFDPQRPEDRRSADLRGLRSLEQRDRRDGLATQRRATRTGQADRSNFIQKFLAPGRWKHCFCWNRSR